MSELDSSTEDWQAIPGWEGYYELSSHRRVRSLDRKVPSGKGGMTSKVGTLMKARTEARTGREFVVFSRKGEDHKYFIDELVDKTFGEPPPATDAARNGPPPVVPAVGGRLDQARELIALAREAEGLDIATWLEDQARQTITRALGGESDGAA